MTEPTHKACFGKMFPDDLHSHDNVPNEGKAFTVLLESTCGVMRTRTNRQVSVKVDEWDDCQRCPEFESCYRLCIAKATIEGAIASL